MLKDFRVKEIGVKGFSGYRILGLKDLGLTGFRVKGF